MTQQTTKYGENDLMPGVTYLFQIVLCRSRTNTNLMENKYNNSITSKG